MTTPDLLAQLNFARFCILTNCEGISDEQALLEPTKDGNPANRIAGHIVATRRSLFPVLNLEHPWSEEQCSVYNTPWVEVDRAKLDPLSEIMRVEAQTFEQLANAVQNFKGNWDEHWPGSRPDRPQTYGQRVQFFMLHECYHAGQIGTLRKAIGLSGKI